MQLLNPRDCPAIRAALDVSLDAGSLPDRVILLDIYVGQGEAMVLARDPLALTRTGDERTHVRNAAMLFTAALLAPAVVTKTTEQFDNDYRYQRPAVDASAQAANLRARAQDELDVVLNPGTDTDDDERPTMFSLARGRRGR